ncbi:hypothetical protein [Amycolatopsis nigrescens]|uniref:hypothetical protein n=1 Tax=Amycolatopsis nigrescens TaxID=381445 RepID=UPI0012F7D54D|nr:hypothetical protein [Amycolatopsis nigrescens]
MNTGSDELTAPLLAIAAESGDTDREIAALVRDGLLRSEAGLLRIAPEVVPVVRAAVRAQTPDRSRDDYARVCLALRTAEDTEAAEDTAGTTGWLLRHRFLLITVLEGATAAGAAEQAALTAAAWWDIADRVDDPRWHRALADAGEDAAITSEIPAVLSEVLERSARHAARQGDHLAAEARWVRALAIWREADDLAGCVRVLESLTALYRGWARLHRALDALFELLSLRERAGDELMVAHTVWAIGTVTLEAGRVEAAVDYLHRAEKTLRPRAAEAGGAYADVAVALGRAQWLAGRYGSARSSFSRALAVLVDVDELRAEEVRVLLGLPENAPLPAARIIDRGTGAAPPRSPG